MTQAYTTHSKNRCILWKSLSFKLLNRQRLISENSTDVRKYVKRAVYNVRFETSSAVSFLNYTEKTLKNYFKLKIVRIITRSYCTMYLSSNNL